MIFIYLKFPKVNLMQKGHVALIQGVPAKLTDKTVSKTGKHGHAKANMSFVEFFGTKKIEASESTSASLDIPILVIKNDPIVQVTEGKDMNNLPEYTVTTNDAKGVLNTYTITKEQFTKTDAALKTGKTVNSCITTWRDYVLYDFKIQT